MINIGICDDEIVWVEEMKKILFRYGEENHREILVEVYNSAEDFVDSDLSPDILLLDIEMPGASGIELKEFIAMTRKEIAIIFISSHIDFMAEAYGPNVYGFIAKPINASILNSKLSKIISVRDKALMFEIDDKVSVMVNDILYIISNDKYVDVITLKTVHSCYLSLKECQKNLTPNFYRVNKSHLINFEHVKHMRETIEMIDGYIINTSRGKTMTIKNKYREALRNKLKNGNN
ncbi:MAG: LytTR family DNA-binding domain-containing protein [Lachnospiraceae bacterium]|nr:LytTR family DNA-binding domain-containing protein [Lachnospiraceae bacterium]